MGSGYFNTNYRDEIKIFQTRFVKFWLILFAIFLALFPSLADPYLTYLINISMIAIIAALGLNILTGYTGQLSLGHAAFIAIGAYSSGLITSRLGVSFWLALPLAGFVAGFFGFLVGIPALRLKGLYLIMATMAFSFIIQYVLIRWDSLTNSYSG
ncbi:MAG: branched-chain amino acid ABC transporter permease, partial [Deltaproteobacteria bacterium]